MKRQIRVAGSILVIGFCVLFGCRQKENGVLLLEEPADTYQIPEETIQETQALEETAQPSDLPETLVVHICGYVKEPGVYTLEKGSRVYEAIEAAGGFAQGAMEAYLNQADFLQDGMKLYVPSKEEVGENFLLSGDSVMTGSTEGSKVNINTADETLLRTLPGVGESKAKSIIAYREKNGSFGKIEDIMNVEGIKEGLFRKIEDGITVN
ncbi:putative uncharacterized protein [Firmicutes bacterium CAG:534]|nr:putative uncharacterized protein [Firmicutes bacterium CAG:534]